MSIRVKKSKDAYKIVTCDESWIYAYEPGTKQQFTVRLFETDPNPTKFVYGKITSKLMIGCFFGKTGHVATIPLEHRRTINSEWSNFPMEMSDFNWQYQKYASQ